MQRTGSNRGYLNDDIEHNSLGHDRVLVEGELKPLSVKSKPLHRCIVWAFTLIL